MAKFNGDEIARRVGEACELERAPEVLARGGDYDMEGLVFRAKGADDAVLVRPFVDPNGPTTSLSTGEVFAVALATSESDSRGGLQTGDSGTAKVFFEVERALRALHYRVILNCDEIF